MSLKLYYDLLSQPSRVLYIFLRKTGIPYEDKPIKLARGEHQSEEFENVNPFKKVPAIEHGNFKLTESIAILRYLCRENKIADHWYPKDSKKQAKVDEYLEWQHIETRLNCAMYFQMKYLRPMLSGKPADPKKVALFEDRMVNCLDQINDIWLKDTLYLAGNEISIADIVGACEVEQPRIAGYDPCQGRPKLAAWLNRVRSDLDPHYLTAHALLNRLIEKYKGVPPTSLSKL